MSLSELLPEVSNLPRQDKEMLLQYLTSTLAANQDTSQITGGTNFAVWSPYGAFEAAQTLQQALEAEVVD